MFEVEIGSGCRLHGGMNKLTEHDRKLAETLKSLTLVPSAEISKPPFLSRRWPIGILLFAASAAAVALVSPHAFQGITTRVFGQPEPAKLDQATSSQVANEGGHLTAITAPSRQTAREITGSGYVVAPRATALFSKYEGKVTAIAVDVGDHVQAGQLLVILDDASARLDLEQQQAAKVSADLVLAAREITLAQAAAALRRAKTLAHGNVGSVKELEEAETAWKNAQNNVEQSRQDVVRAKLTITVAEERVDELRVHAPFAGTVTKLNTHIGDTVLSRVDSVRESQSLLTLTDTTNMVIDADMAEANLALLRPGLVGEATLDGFPDQSFGIELQRVAPIVSVEKGTIGIRLSLVNPPAGIRPNMAARIRITIPEPQDKIGDARP